MLRGIPDDVAVKRRDRQAIAKHEIMRIFYKYLSFAITCDSVRLYINEKDMSMIFDDFSDAGLGIKKEHIFENRLTYVSVYGRIIKIMDKGRKD